METKQPITKQNNLATGSKLKRRAWLLGGAALLLVATVYVAWWFSVRMPGSSYAGPTIQMETSEPEKEKSEQPIANKEQANDATPNNDSESEKPEGDPNSPNDALNEQPLDVSHLAAELERYVVHLATVIGERNIAEYDALCEAADYVEERLKAAEFEMSRQTYQLRGVDCFNIIGERVGTQLPEEVVIIGAHYDSVLGTPGANDNASGVASMLALANHFSDHSFKRTVRFVGFTNEEPPYFQNEGEMGSWVYAQACRKADEKIVAVLSLETMGYFSDEKNSQEYPPPLSVMYPSTGNFIGFVANLGSRPLLHKALKCFRDHAKVPSEGAAMPGQMPGVGWSDHWSFWQEGFQGVMITDTAPFRYPHYHRSTDTPDKIKYGKLALVVGGLKPVVDLLANEEND